MTSTTMANSTFQSLPTEMKVEIFSYLDYRTICRMRQTCSLINKIINLNGKNLQKFRAKRVTLRYTIPPTSCQPQNSPKMLCNLEMDDGYNSTELEILSERDLNSLLNSICIEAQLFIIASQHDFCTHFAVVPEVKLCKQVVITNVGVDTPVSKIIPLMRRLKKCNNFSLVGRCLFNGKLSDMIEHMDFIKSIGILKSPRLIFDDKALAIITSKTTPTTPFLLLDIGNVDYKITVEGFMTFMRNTNFCNRTIIRLSRLVASRDQFMISLGLEQNDDTQDHFDFIGTYISNDGSYVRLSIERFLTLSNSY